MSMRVIPFAIFLYFLALLTLSPAKADQSGLDQAGSWNFCETTGLISIPTAKVEEGHHMTLYIRMAKLGQAPPKKGRSGDPNEGFAGGTPFDSDWWIDNDGDRGLIWGVFKNFELGAMNIHSYTLGPTIGIKYLLREDRGGFPAVAVGAHNIFRYHEDSEYFAANPELTINSETAPFIVATKSLGDPSVVDLTAGFGSGRFRKRLFYGGELHLGKTFSAIGEYDGRFTSFGIKARFSPWQIFVCFQDNMRKENWRNYGCGISYTFDLLDINLFGRKKQR